MGKKCTVKDCEQYIKCKSLCNKHYQRFRKYGSPYIKKMSFEKHGLHKLPEYAVWQAMKQRCYNPKNAQYIYYGLRGIKVCERWRNSFTEFISDMGFRPNDSLELDRIDNDGNYCKDNCRWASRKQQMTNRSQNRNNTSGYRGVRKYGKYWQARITTDRKEIHLGYFDNPELAYKKYLEAREKYHA